MKKYIGYSILAIIVVGIIGFVIWTQIYYHATPYYLDILKENTGLTIINEPQHIIITPNSGKIDHTLIFYPGAKIESQAYIYKLGTIALDHNIEVIIDKPIARLQIFGINNADLISGNNLIIAGHSLGGAMACEYVHDHPHRISGMILMGAYCNSDISDLTGIQTLLFAASNDGLISPEVMKTYNHNLPSDHKIYIISGAIHAQYGNYGAQDGDGALTIGDDQVLQELSDEIGRFMNSIQ